MITERETCCLPSKEFLIEMKTFSVTFLLTRIQFACGKDEADKVSDVQDKPEFIMIITQIPKEGPVALGAFMG